MSPGDIDQLALSDEVAFRVRFATATPPPARTLLARTGACTISTDTPGGGRNATRRPALQPLGPAYRYTVSLEPHRHQWIFILDWPAYSGIFRERSSPAIYTLVQRDPVSRPIDVDAHLVHPGSSRRSLGHLARNAT